MTASMGGARSSPMSPRLLARPCVSQALLMARTLLGRAMPTMSAGCVECRASLIGGHPCLLLPPLQIEVAEVLSAVVKRQDGLAAEMGALREQVAQLLRKQERAAWI